MTKAIWIYIFLIVSIISYSQPENYKKIDMKNYKKITIDKINENVIKLVANDWMLVTSGSLDSFNTMTASWGGFGYLWNKQISIIFIRPQRYTFEFIEKAQTYTLTFFDHEKYKEALTICGTKSGRDCNKIKLAGLTPMVTENNNIAFNEARIVIECKVVYGDFLKPELMEQGISNDIYPQKDYHKMYIGEILNVWIKE